MLEDCNFSTRAASTRHNWWMVQHVTDYKSTLQMPKWCDFQLMWGFFLLISNFPNWQVFWLLQPNQINPRSLILKQWFNCKPKTKTKKNKRNPNFHKNPKIKPTSWSTKNTSSSQVLTPHLKSWNHHHM